MSGDQTPHVPSLHVSVNPNNLGCWGQAGKCGDILPWPFVGVKRVQSYLAGQRRHARPSPSSNFFSEMGSLPVWFVTSGGRKMQWMPCIIAQEMLQRFCPAVSFVAAMKLLTKTSRRHIGSGCLLMG
eukprot:708453-Ditylum_brightwellii.AAC.1